MSVVYEVKCAKCGNTTDQFVCSLDSTEDLCVEVDPCQTCMDEKHQEGVDSVQESDF